MLLFAGGWGWHAEAGIAALRLLVTAGGIYSQRMLLDAVATVGVDRVLFASDDPFGGDPRIPLTRDFLRSAPVSEMDRIRVARGNAEQHVLKTAGPA